MGTSARESKPWRLRPRGWRSRPKGSPAASSTRSAAVTGDAERTAVDKPGAAVRSLTNNTGLSGTEGTGVRRGIATPRRVVLGTRPPALRAGSTPVTPHGAAGPAGGGPTAWRALPAPTRPPAGIRVAQIVDRNPPSGSGRIGERRDRGDPPGDDDPADDWGTATGAGARDWGRAGHGHEDLRRRDAPRSSEATARGAPRRQPTDTHVSQEQRDAADGGRLVRSSRLPPPATVAGIESRIAIGWAGPPAFWGGHLFCGHDAEAPHGACAACSLWRELQNTRLPCGHQPDDTRPMNCDVCRFYLEDLDERSGHPRRLECGQPAAAPIPRSGCLAAARPGARTGRWTCSSAGTRWSGLGATARHAGRAGTCSTRRAGRICSTRGTSPGGPRRATVMVSPQQIRLDDRDLRHERSSGNGAARGVAERYQEGDGL